MYYSKQGYSLTIFNKTFINPLYKYVKFLKYIFVNNKASTWKSCRNLSQIPAYKSYYNCWDLKVKILAADGTAPVQRPHYIVSICGLNYPKAMLEV